MGNSWVRLDAAIARNAKMLAMLSEGPHAYRAAFAYVCALGYCGEQQSDGYVPAAALPFIHARPRDADLLVKHRLWIANRTGWHIRDWAEYQPTSDETHERSRSAKRAACIRWHHPGCMCWTDAESNA